MSINTTQSRDEEASQKLGADPSTTPDVAKNDIELEIMPKQQPATTDSGTNKTELVGVQRIEATTQVWTKPWLYTAYFL